MNVLRPALLTLACMLASPVMSDDLPSLGDASSSIVSPEQEFQLGRAWLSMLRNQVDAISDPQLKDFVESSVYRLAETSDLQDHRLAFILIRDAQINAFAAPGGVIGVNGGLLLNAQTEGRNRAEQYPQGGKEDSLRYQQMRARTQLLFEETPGMAGKRFRAMLNDNPKLDAARYGLAISQTRIGQLNDARDNLRQLLAKAPNDVAYNLAQVELDITANRLPDADQRLKKMLAQFPSSYPLKQVRADLMLKMSKPQESEKILDDLSKARPLDPDVWNRLAEVRSLTNNAIGVHQARAEYLSLTGDYQAAIEQLDFAKRRAGGNFQLAARLDARQQEIRQQEKMVKEMFR